MNGALRVMTWNANGLLKHQEELQRILQKAKIDVCLISETHFTRHSYIAFKNYEIYHRIHPSNCARGDTAVIVKNSIKHNEDRKISAYNIQTTAITLKAMNQPLSITAIYCRRGTKLSLKNI
uniref:RNA-directed DNA polymerase from mobile element jockey n=1 Tax=Zeugodacus cucurbitae TaxID=28588 RepID=A0A0A1WTC5_ZEUCU